jgi:hypothetical protein
MKPSRTPRNAVIVIIVASVPFLVNMEKDLQLLSHGMICRITGLKKLKSKAYKKPEIGHRA